LSASTGYKPGQASMLFGLKYLEGESTV